MNKYFFTISIILLVSSCSDRTFKSNRWPDHLKNNFLNNCMEQNSFQKKENLSNECNCLLNKLESSELIYPFREFESKDNSFSLWLKECLLND